MNNPLSFLLQWPPAPVADTSVRLPPLAEQATIALQDPLPVAYSYGSQSKRDAAPHHPSTYPAGADIDSYPSSKAVTKD